MGKVDEILSTIYQQALDEDSINAVGGYMSESKSIKRAKAELSALLDEIVGEVIGEDENYRLLIDITMNDNEKYATMRRIEHRNYLREEQRNRYLAKKAEVGL